MVNKRQRLARRRRFEDVDGQEEAAQTEKQTAQHVGILKSSKKKEMKKHVEDDDKQGQTDHNGSDKDDAQTGKKKKAKDLNKKHPLRVPGKKPGDGCFLCKYKDHIAKFCFKKKEFDKNKMCLLCREIGHTLKQCPNLDQCQETNLCYNCGQMGHRLALCPDPIKEGGTSFAECFLCKEKGHISRNCPKNPRGIYPKGGSCKICGGVTHLAKDCPEKSGGKKKQSNPVQSKLKISKDDSRGQHTIFKSGDDLEDDFVEDAV